MRILLYSLLSAGFFLTCIPVSLSQITVSNGNHVLEISGMLSAFYNYRALKPGETDKSHNQFSMRDAQLALEGRIGKKFEYEIQVDFADLIAGLNDPENPGLMEASFTYKGLKFVDIRAGFTKMPYSRSNQTPFQSSAYWQRPEIIRGGLFSMRDVGVTLIKTFWKQRINIQGGIYSGMGEAILKGLNDASGKPEYAGRIDLSFPSRYRFTEMDTRHVPIPMFIIGGNIRYVDKTLPAGSLMPAGIVGSYDMKVVDGKKLTYGVDAAFQFKGFSAQFEIHQIRGTPAKDNSILLQGLPKDQTKGYFLAGGWYGQVSYFLKPAKSDFSLRFEELNVSDLVQGKAQRISAAYCYQLNGFNSMIKAQYIHVLSEESIDPYKWTDQFRIGWQLLLK